MSDQPIRLLEDRVHRVVERLRELSSERKRLQDEIQELHGRLSDLEGSSADRAIATDELLKVLTDAIRELRAD